MAEPGSVTALLEQAQAGNQAALGTLVKRYWPFLMVVAGENLPLTHRRAADEEDIVEQAFVDFSLGLLNGSWHCLKDRHHFVALLSTITQRKALNERKHEEARKRGGGALPVERDVQTLSETCQDDGLSPLEQVLQDDWCRHFLDRLGDDLRPVADLLLAGLQKKAIAEALGCTVRTVSRKVVLLQQKWQTLLDEADQPAAAGSPLAPVTT